MSEIRRRLMASVMEKEEEAPWDYLTFTCLTSGSFTFIVATAEMELTGNTTFHNPDFAYRYSVNMDMGEDGWVKVEHINSEGSSEYQEVGFYFTMEAGESVQFKSLFNYVPEIIKGGHGWYFYQTAEQTGTFEVSGSPLSMVFGDNNTTTDLSYFGEYSFLPKFYNNNTSQAFRGLVRIKNPDTFLPSKVLSKRCYEGMFYGCFNLTNAPKLPAKVMANSCYKSMFYKCSSLREAPALPALILDYACYSTMFTYCSNLVQAPVLPATTLTTLCYSGMFSYCTNLSYIKMLAPTLGGSNPLADWVRSVNSNGVFVKSKDATWDVTGVDGVPEGWIVINDGEENADDFGVEFPISLEFDSCEETFVGVECFRAGDDLSAKIYNYIVFIIAKYGEVFPALTIVEEQVLSMLGIEIYLEGYKVNQLIYGDGGYYINTDSVFQNTIIISDGSLICEKN